MRNLYLLLFGLIIFGLNSCKEDPKEGTLTIHFKAVYDSQTLPTFSTRPFENGQRIEFTKLSMFIADLKLVQNSTVRDLDDIEQVNLSFDNDADAAEGYTLKISNIPAGTYNAIRFGIGVPPDLNAKEPADFSSSNPLSKTGDYWVAWSSYIFSKTEGRLDTLGNVNPDLGFVLHTGSDALYLAGESNLSINIEDGKETNLDILLDYKTLLMGVNIKDYPQNHTPADTAQINKIVNNYGAALTLVL